MVQHPLHTVKILLETKLAGRQPSWQLFQATQSISCFPTQVILNPSTFINGSIQINFLGLIHQSTKQIKQTDLLIHVVNKVSQNLKILATASALSLHLDTPLVSISKFYVALFLSYRIQERFWNFDLQPLTLRSSSLLFSWGVKKKQKHTYLWFYYNNNQMYPPWKLIETVENQICACFKPATRLAHMSLALWGEG